MTTIETSTKMKTLPLKFKLIHYGLMSFLTSNTEIIGDENVKKLLEKLPIFNGIEEQVSFYEKFDLKDIEKNIAKPMIKEHKDTIKKAEKTEKKESKTKENEDKKPTKTIKRTSKKESSKKTITSANVLSCSPEEMKLTEEMIEEPYEETSEKMSQEEQKPAKKEISKKERSKKEKKPVKEEYEHTLEKGQDKPIEDKIVQNGQELNEEEDMYMIKLDGQRYWTPDEYFKNGPIFDSTIDEDGDPTPGIQVGVLVDGEATIEV